MTYTRVILCFILSIVSVEISWQVKTTTTTPTLQPSRNGNIVPTVEFCSGMHPPGYNRTATSRPTPYQIYSNYYHANRITTCISNKMGIYYFGVILQFRWRGVAVDGNWKVRPYPRDQQLLFETLVDCPPGVKNTLYLSTQHKPMWFVCFDWRPTNISYMKKTLSLRATVVRKGNIYWRMRAKVYPYFMLDLVKTKFPTMTTRLPKMFIHRSSITTTEIHFEDHTWRDERGKMHTYRSWMDKQLLLKDQEMNTLEMLRYWGWVSAPDSD